MTDWERRIVRGADGIEVRLDDDARSLLGHLIDQMSELFDESAGDERMRRVFPTAYHADPELDAEYQRLMRDELITSHRSALSAVRETLGASTLTEPQAMAWARQVNTVRLVLGTLLDVGEDDDTTDLEPNDPAYGLAMLYSFLGGLLVEIIDAL